jgi:MYXO-CTERM domain-containing protein
MRRKIATALVGGILMIGAPRAADAFCGFYISGADAKLYNNATMVVMMREGQRTVLSMQNNYQGPPENFAMVVPVPVVLQKENVKTLDRAIFDRVDRLAAPRLVEYWEQDPCAPVPPPMAFAAPGAVPRTAAAKGGGGGDLGVKIEAQFTVGEYEVVILSAQDSTGLDTWLKREKYKIPDGSEPYLRPYVQSGSKFFVAKVDAKKVKFDNGMATLSPLRFHYDTEKFSLPIRLGLVNSQGAQDLIVHILAKGQRYDVANYPTATIPTNFDVSEAARGNFGSFYATLFDKTIEKTPKAVITEYSWDASTCDPCPSPALSYNEIATLGADALPSAAQNQGPGGGGKPAKPGAAPMPMRPWFVPSGFVLTRLHARYTKDTLGEDLVFKEAPPIMGGREVQNQNGELEHGAQPGSYNNFQGRYAIRHPWQGPIACENPRRGIWGGPPPGVTAQGGGGPQPALNLAFAPRNAQLTSFIASPVPELGLTPQATPAPAVPSASAAPSSSAPSNTGATPPQGSRGCGCSSADSTGGGVLAFFGAALALAGFARRKKG